MAAVSTFDLLTGKDFLTAFGYGSMAAAIATLAGFASRRSGRSAAPVGGLGLAVAAALALGRVIDVPAEVWSGVVLLAVGAALGSLTESFPVLVMGVVPGAWIMAFQLQLPGPRWVSALVFGALVGGVPLAADFDRRYRDAGFGPALLALAVAGLFFTVPDTETAVVLLGVAVPIGVAGWPLRAVSLGAPGVAMSLGIFVWVAAVGGQARPASVIGAVAALGLLVAEPLGRRLLRTDVTVIDDLAADPSGALVVGAAQFLLVFVASRVAGLRSDPLAATTIAFGLLVVASWLTGRRGRVPT